jgi:hypothetical protein
MAVNLLSLAFFIWTVTLSIGCDLNQNHSCDAVLLKSEEDSSGIFSFSSGNAFHFEGFGEWKFELDAFGILSITQNVRGIVKDYGNFRLTEEEKLKLWNLVLAINIEKMNSSTRKGNPDETQYTFLLTYKEQVHTLQMWSNDANKNNNIVTVVNRIATLIEKYTGDKPVLF